MTTYRVPQRDVARDAAEFYLAQMLDYRASMSLGAAVGTVGNSDAWVMAHGSTYYESAYHELASQRALANYHAAKRPLERITAELLEWMVPYTVGAILGEYRHAADKVAHVHTCELCGEVPYMSYNGASRSAMVCQPFAMSASELANTVEPLENMLECFRTCRWPKGFGGKAWAKITEHALLWLTGKLPATVWLDRCFDLAHNTGTYFDKLSTLSIYSLKYLLDGKLIGDDELCARAREHADELPSDLVWLSKRYGLLIDCSSVGIPAANNGSRWTLKAVYEPEEEEENDYDDNDDSDYDDNERRSA